MITTLLIALPVVGPVLGVLAIVTAAVLLAWATDSRNDSEEGSRG